MAGKWLRWLKGWCGAGEIEIETEIEWIGGEAAKVTQLPLFRGEGDHEVVEGCR